MAVFSLTLLAISPAKAGTSRVGLGIAPDVDVKWVQNVQNDVRP